MDHPAPGTIGPMSGGRPRRLELVSASALAIAGLLSAGAAAAPPYGQVSFRTPSQFPTFGPHVHDYVVRCNDGPVTVRGHASGAWRVAIGNRPYRRGEFSRTVPLGTGRAFTVTAKRDTSTQLYRYHVRCLPNRFPKYSFTRYGQVSPKYFSVDEAFYVPLKKRYAIIFDNRGVPIWWHRAPARDPRVLPGGNLLWLDFISYRWEIHRLDGSLVRTLNAVGEAANPHDLQLLGTGDYLVGSYVPQGHVDTSVYGGSSDATVINAELQQVGPGRTLVWDWKSQDHISLAATGRWWRLAVNNGYDIAHWNSIEPDGDSVIASFRHLDAVYKIVKSSGRIVWKLGGTRTAKSLEVKHDPRASTFGGQHDARLLPDGTLTVFDNRTNRRYERPRAVRYRIDQEAGTATLLQSITDPDVPTSRCCGSARRLGNGDWLIDWSLPNGIGGYRPDGHRTFRLIFDSTVSYRAEPVPPGAVSARDLRHGMNAMCSSGCD
jgi:arylsulfotransferase ASST